jgi:hypothetical protein
MRWLAGHLFTPTGAMRAWATVTMLIVGFGVALGLTIGYVRKVDADAERRNVERSREICGLIVMIDDVNQQAPAPTGPNAEQVKAYRIELHRYRQTLGC